MENRNFHDGEVTARIVNAEKRLDLHAEDIRTINVKIETELKPINARQNQLIGAFSLAAAFAATVATKMIDMFMGHK